MYAVLYSNQEFFKDVLVMFVVGLLDEDGIVVDMLEFHDLLVKDLNLAKICQIPDSTSNAERVWAKIFLAGQASV